jgi:cysteine synthase A
MNRTPTLSKSILDAIGDTPLVEVTQLARARKLKGRLLVKCEYLNPGSSKKDRIALEMIQEARARGDLRPQQVVIELTSGNTGTGLAIVCRALGHPFVAVMSRGNTMERARMMRALGAEVVLVDQVSGSLPNQVSGDDLALVEERTRELTNERGAFRCDQFILNENVLAHERHTGPEIWQQANEQIDVFLDFAGTVGTFTGIMRHLRRMKPDVRGYLVEPSEVAVLAGCSVTKASHKIQGGGYSKRELALLDRSLVNGYLQVIDEEAKQGARILAEETGIFAGFSAGANLAAAYQLLAGSEPEATIAFLAADSGLKYLSTDLYPS